MSVVFTEYDEEVVLNWEYREESSVVNSRVHEIPFMG
jgi:hypothetical protein